MLRKIPLGESALDGDGAVPFLAAPSNFLGVLVTSLLVGFTLSRIRLGFAVVFLSVGSGCFVIIGNCVSGGFSPMFMRV